MTQPTYSTEFHRLGNELMSKMKKVTQDYPLLTAIFTVAAAFFGFMTLLHFSISAIVTSAMLLALASGLGITIAKEGGSYWKGLGTSLLNIGKFITGTSKK